MKKINSADVIKSGSLLAGKNKKIHRCINKILLASTVLSIIVQPVQSLGAPNIINGKNVSEIKDNSYALSKLLNSFSTKKGNFEVYQTGVIEKNNREKREYERNLKKLDDKQIELDRQKIAKPLEKKKHMKKQKELDNLKDDLEMRKNDLDKKQNERMKKLQSEKKQLDKLKDEIENKQLELNNIQEVGVQKVTDEEIDMLVINALTPFESSGSFTGDKKLEDEVNTLVNQAPSVEIGNNSQDSYSGQTECAGGYIDDELLYNYPASADLENTPVPVARASTSAAVGSESMPPVPVARASTSAAVGSESMPPIPDDSSLEVELPAENGDNKNPLSAYQVQEVSKIAHDTASVKNLYHAVSMASESSQYVVDSTISHRLNSQYNGIVASGDENNKMPQHVWISGVFAKDIYKGSSTLPKYSGKTKVATIGADTEMPDGSVIGGSYNYIMSDFKFKQSPEKIAVKTHLLSLYGQTNLTDKLVLQGLGSVGFGNISIKSPSKTKAKNISYSAKSQLAYNINAGNTRITPHAGIKYGRYNMGSYDQGIGDQALSVAGTKNNRFSVLVGFNATKSIRINETTQLIPGTHAEAERFLSKKQKNIKTKASSGQEILLTTEKPSKYSYIVGSSLTLKKGPTEISAVYDYLSTGKKHSSHQGSIKLRVSF